MANTILQEDIETYILFGIAPVYFIVLSIIQNQYLKSLEQIENKYIKPDVKEGILSNQKVKKDDLSLFINWSGSPLNRISDIC